MKSVMMLFVINIINYLSYFFQFSQVLAIKLNSEAPSFSIKSVLYFINFLASATEYKFTFYFVLTSTKIFWNYWALIIFKELLFNPVLLIKSNENFYETFLTYFFCFKSACKYSLKFYFLLSLLYKLLLF